MKKEELISLAGLSSQKADELMLLEEVMFERAVRFQYRKTDGSIRQAVGTLKRGLMRLADGSIWEPKESSPNSDNVGVLKYFDLDAHAWRSFKVENFLSML